MAAGQTANTTCITPLEFDLDEFGEDFGGQGLPQLAVELGAVDGASLTLGVGAFPVAIGKPPDVACSSRRKAQARP